MQKLDTKLKVDDTLIELFNRKNESVPTASITVKKALKRSNINIFDINETYNLFESQNKQVLDYVNTVVKYEGYIAQQEEDINKMLKQEEILLPQDLDYDQIKGIRLEAREKLNQVKPLNIGQASRISGVSPADISVLIIYVKSLNG